MFTYIRKINYHETDKMAVVHHSNYVKYMEESRVAFLSAIGVEYADFEAEGIVSPVVSINVEYKTPARFGDTLTIDVRQTQYSGPRLSYSYEMRNQEGKLVCKASSQHCFIYQNRILSLQNGFEHYHQKLVDALEQ